MERVISVDRLDVQRFLVRAERPVQQMMIVEPDVLDSFCAAWTVCYDKQPKLGKGTKLTDSHFYPYFLVSGYLRGAQVIETLMIFPSACMVSDGEAVYDPEGSLWSIIDGYVSSVHLMHRLREHPEVLTEIAERLENDEVVE